MRCDSRAPVPLASALSHALTAAVRMVVGAVESMSAQALRWRSMTSSIGLTLSGASGFLDPSAARIEVARERAGRRGEFGADFVGRAGHEGGNRTGEATAFVGIVALAVAHDERAEIGEAQSQRAENMRILRDRRGRIAGVVDENFLRGDVHAHGRLEAR